MKIISEIAHGGFGVIHTVEDDSGALMARKLFKPTVLDGDGRLKGRFIREVRTQSRMRHPNVMPILTSDLSSDPPWFVMPLASATYTDKIQEDRKRGVIDAKPWLDIFSGVEEIHRLGFVHRDLKPANILLVGTDWRISDFGTILPPIRETKVLTRNTAFGSERYAAPEQARDFKNATEAADIFSLGCILHDLVGNPFDRTPYSQISVDGPYREVLAKCTAVDPNQRYGTVEALRAALFDVWQTGVTLQISSESSIALNAVLARLKQGEGWDEFIKFVEREDVLPDVRSLALRALSADAIVALHGLSDVLFERLVSAYCEWVESSVFDFAYCDVLGDRLSVLYSLGRTRVKLKSILASMELAVYHNRWRVMRFVVGMLSSGADQGVIDRMVMELGDAPELVHKLQRVESELRLPRSAWHEKIAAML